MPTARTPECTDDHFLSVEGVVEMTRDIREIEPTQPGDAGIGIERSYAGEPSHDSKSLVELVREYFCMDSVLKPPFLLVPDVTLGRRGESNPALLQ